MFIHDPSYFKREKLIERTKKFELPDPVALELLLWDYEIVAHFQQLSDSIILKGGAACQLMLPINAQRGSIDLDLVSSLDKSDIEVICAQVEKNLGAKFRLHKPIHPIPKLPLLSYFVEAPTSFPQPKRKNLEIQTEILMQKTSLPVMEITNTQTVALEVERVKCYTNNTLVGDKLLTLAKGSIGIPERRMHEYPKQIYDIDLLLHHKEIKNQEDLRTVLETVETLTKLEAKYREIELEPEEALKDVIRTMKEYAIVDTPSANPEIKKSIENFQQFYVSRQQRLPSYGWSIRALKIAFVTDVLLQCLERKKSQKGTLETIGNAIKIENAMKELKGERVSDIRKKLLEMITKKIDHFKELKGKPLHRVYWQVATPDNINEIGDLLG